MIRTFRFANFIKWFNIEPMENLAEIVGKNLVALRKAKGMTQMQLASEINYSDKSISKWENGYALPTVDVLADFARYYGVSVDYLITKQEEESIAEVIEEKKEQEKKDNPNKITIMAMAAFIFILIAALVIAVDYMYGIHGPDPLYGHDPHYWPIAFWMMPLIFLVESFLTRIFYRNKLAAMILNSLCAWSLLAAVVFHYWFWLDQNITYIFTVGIPIQVILALIYTWKPRK